MTCNIMLPSFGLHGDDSYSTEGLLWHRRAGLRVFRYDMQVPRRLLKGLVIGVCTVTATSQPPLSLERTFGVRCQSYTGVS